MKRISLNLGYFYQDFRRMSKICINNDIETIGDLQEHIAKIFGISTSFYLLSKTCYLPPAENIALLDDKDLIWVVPKIQTPHVEKNDVSEDLSKKFQKHHESVSNIEEIENEKPLKIKKKKKSAKYEDDEIKLAKKVKKSENVDVEMNNNEEIQKLLDDLPKVPKHKKKKRKKSELVFEVGDNKVNPRSETAIYENCKTNNSEQNMAVNETEIIINHQIEMCENPEVKIRKRRRCISLPKEKDQVTSTEIYSQETPIISKENEKMQTSPKFIVQSIEIIKKGINEQNGESLNDEFKNPNEILQKSPPLQNGSKKRFSKTYKQHSGVGGTIKMISAENSVTEDSGTDDTILSENFITKRRRTRSRRRKPKTTDLENSLIDSAVETAVFHPPKTIAAPKSHIKFQNDEMEFVQNISNPNLTQEYFNFTQTTTNLTENISNLTGNVTDSNLSIAHSTPKSTSLHNFKNKEILNNFIQIENLTINDMDISNFNELKATENPPINSFILFKKLKMGTDYQPNISNYILGKVEDIVEHDKLKLKILDGHNELKEPRGRFSCILEDEENETEVENEDSIIVERFSLIDPKLYNLKE